MPKAKSSDKGEQLRQLKLHAWTEVRPFEWPNLNAAERTTVARAARAALKQLKVPETDPVWEHSRWREPESVAAAAGPSSARPSGTNTPVEAKRGVVAQSAKTAKKAQAADPVRKKAVPSIIIAKDESARARDEMAKNRDDGSIPGTPTTMSRPGPTRKVPGSGYKSKSSASPPADPLPPPPPSLPKKPVLTAETRDTKREAATPSTASKAGEHERKTSSLAVAAARIRQREAQPSMERHKRDRDAASPAPKRKLIAEDESSYSEREVPLRASATKKRKVEEPDSRRRERDTLPVPKKREREPSPVPPLRKRQSPLPPPRMKIKKEASPLPPPKPKVKKEASPALSISPPSRGPSPAPQRRHASDKERSAKTRRRSPIQYTSSEDESEGSAPVARPPPPRPKKLASWKPQQSLPDSREGLQAYYKRCFLVYIRLYQEQVARRARIEEMLDGADDEDAMDVDAEELNPDAVVAFMKEMREVTDEMERIRKAWEKLGGHVGESGELVDEEA